MSDVIEISDSDDEVIDVDDWVSVDAAAAPRGHAQGRTAAAAAAAQTEEDEDAALARRLQEEEWGQGGGGGVAAAPRADFGGDAPGLDFEESDLDASRRHRREQDAAYEASLAADRRREAEAREKQAAEAAAAASAAAAAAAAAAEAAAAEAALRDAEAMKRQARERWLAAAEPAAGAVGVVNVSLRFSDGALEDRCAPPRVRCALTAAPPLPQARASCAASTRTRLWRPCSTPQPRSGPSPTAPRFRSPPASRAACSRARRARTAAARCTPAGWRSRQASWWWPPTEGTPPSVGR
jgi:hypothetical protein